ncbi:MAG: LD-carboxypeptidase [Clostridia bacterium]|nr:LD-carboxypeptidase [Clostridia bacterium]
MHMIRPKPLRPGDTVAMIGVSGCVHQEDPRPTVDEAEALLTSLGFRVKVDPTCAEQYGFLSGTDRERADALNRAFADPSVDGVWCLKGGYGVTRMLPLVDWDLIASHPKAFIGFSDITALHMALHQRCSLETFHGPMPSGGRITEASRPSLLAALAGEPEKTWSNLNGESLYSLRPGTAEGILVGGNLSLLATGCGTPWDLDTTDKLLFIEEVGEHTYRVDEFLWQLQHAGKLDACRGIVLGGFTEITEEYPHSHCFSLEEILGQMAGRVRVPMLAGLQAGHTGDQKTLCLGRRYRLDANRCALTILD